VSAVGDEIAGFVGRVMMRPAVPGEMSRYCDQPSGDGGGRAAPLRGSRGLSHGDADSSVGRSPSQASTAASPGDSRGGGGCAETGAGARASAADVLSAPWVVTQFLPMHTSGPRADEASTLLRVLEASMN